MQDWPADLNVSEFDGAEQPKAEEAEKDNKEDDEPKHPNKQ